MKQHVADQSAHVVRLADRNKLLTWSLGVAVVFYIFWELSPSHQEVLDPFLVLSIGITKQTIVLMMLLYTVRWSWRGLGVMSVMQGVAILYMGAAWLHWQPEYMEWAEAVTDLGRAFLIVGLIPLVIGVIRYIYDRRRGVQTQREVI